MSEFQTVSESELQSIEGGYPGQCVVDAVVKTVVSTAVYLMSWIP